MDLNLGSYEARILRGALMQYRTIDYEHDKREKKRRGQSRERFVNAINTGMYSHKCVKHVVLWRLT